MVFIALVIAVARWDCSSNPYAGLVVFVAVPAIVRARTAAHSGRDVAGSAGDSQHHPEATRDWPVFDFRNPTTSAERYLPSSRLTAVNIVIILLAG